MVHDVRPGARRTATARRPGHVALARALSKLGLASRSQAIALVLDGRVRVDGRVCRDPGALVVPERAILAIDEVSVAPPPWRTIALHKPRGVVTTRHDPEARPTVYELIAGAGDGLAPAGRLDMASTGLLVCTNDTQLAAWLTDPRSGVEREYAVTVRGRMSAADAARFVAGITTGGQDYRATAATIRKASNRETHLLITLTEGRNREIRRLCESVGHEVTRVHRIRIGGLVLGDLAPGRWRIISEEMLKRAFPGVF